MDNMIGKSFTSDLFDDNNKDDVFNHYYTHEILDKLFVNFYPIICEKSCIEHYFGKIKENRISPIEIYIKYKKLDFFYNELSKESDILIDLNFECISKMIYDATCINKHIICIDTLNKEYLHCIPFYDKHNTYKSSMEKIICISNDNSKSYPTIYNEFYCKLLYLLIKHSINMHCIDLYGISFLFYLIIGREVELIKLLFDNNYNIYLDDFNKEIITEYVITTYNINSEIIDIINILEEHNFEFKINNKYTFDKNLYINIPYKNTNITKEHTLYENMQNNEELKIIFKIPENVYYRLNLIVSNAKSAAKTVRYNDNKD